MDYFNVFIVFSEFLSPCTGKSTRCPFPPGRHPPPDSRPPAQKNGTQIKHKFPSAKNNEGFAFHLSIEVFSFWPEVTTVVISKVILYSRRVFQKKKRKKHMMNQTLAPEEI